MQIISRDGVARVDPSIAEYRSHRCLGPRAKALSAWLLEGILPLTCALGATRRGQIIACNFNVPFDLGPAPNPAAADTIVATIEYFWKDPGRGYAAHFRDQPSPAYRAAGLPVIGAFVAEDQPNNFPRLYVRHNERVFVWFTSVRAPRDYAAAMRKLEASARWRLSLGPSQKDYLERQPQALMLSPTARSILR